MCCGRAGIIVNLFALDRLLLLLDNHIRRDLVRRPVRQSDHRPKCGRHECERDAAVGGPFLVSPVQGFKAPGYWPFYTSLLKDEEELTIRRASTFLLECSGHNSRPGQPPRYTYSVSHVLTVTMFTCQCATA